MKTREEVLLVRDEMERRAEICDERGDAGAASSCYAISSTLNWVMGDSDLDEIDGISREALDEILRQGQARHAESN